MGLIGGKPKQWFGRRRWVGDVDRQSMIWGWVSVEMEDWVEAWVGDVDQRLGTWVGLGW